MIKRIWNKFWSWYERNYKLNLGLSTGLFLLQLIHLYWLSADVVAQRLGGHSHFELHGFWEILVLLVDYTEIPALISVSLVYVNGLRKGWNFKDFLYLVFLNSQWLHIFWITDEFVIGRFDGNSESVLPYWLVWVAIGIDYLELPVIYDTVKKFLASLVKNVEENKG